MFERIALVLDECEFQLDVMRVEYELWLDEQARTRVQQEQDYERGWLQDLCE